MLHDPENLAPGSMEILLVTTSPLNFADAFRDNNCSTFTFALIVPDKSAFWHSISPSMLPVSPTTILPLQLIEPIRLPSILKSPDAITSPLIIVPVTIVFVQVFIFIKYWIIFLSYYKSIKFFLFNV